MGRSESTNSEDNYVPMNPGSSTLLATERAGDNSQSVYIPMSPGPHHFEGLGYPSTALSMHRGPSRGSEIQPPPVNRNLKPDRKGKSPLSRRWTVSRSGLHSFRDRVDPELSLPGSVSLWSLSHPKLSHTNAQIRSSGPAA